MSLVDALKKTLSINPTSDNALSQLPLSFVKSRKAILRELISAKENGALIGVYSKAMGEGMFLVGINEVETDSSSEIIVFETYDQCGTILNRTRLSIEEIKMVCPLGRKYVNPVLNKVHSA
jgi:hypothetical protein